MAKDRYRYFRVEARELLEGLAQGILQLEKGAAAPDAQAHLLRLAHTLKGAARVVNQPGIAELAHAVEDRLTAPRDGGERLSKEQGSELLRLFDEIAARLSALEPAVNGGGAGPARSAAEEPLATLRVEVGEMDALVRTVAEAEVRLSAVRKDFAAADRLRDLTNLLLGALDVQPSDDRQGASPEMARARPIAEAMQDELDHFRRSLDVDLERVEGELAELRHVAHRLRLIPAQSVFPSLDLSVRDAAQTLGKSAVFEATGGDVRLDASVLASLRDALMHVVRNAVAHGIEDGAERVAQGKPAAGNVRLEVQRRGGRVAFLCTDDGRGIDVEAVRTAAVAHGLLLSSQADSLPSDQVIALLLAGGLTTSRDVTELAGRGIGLDVVRATTSRLKGEVRIRSEPGRGTSVEILVPVSIASLRALVVESAGTPAAIPLDAVRQTLRVRDTELVRTAESDSLLHDGSVIPFLSLARVLRHGNPAGKRPSVWSAVVVQSGERRVAVGVERLLGTAEIVMRALPGVAGAERVVAGASLDAEGNPQLVLDPAGLVAAAEGGRGAAADDSEPLRAPVLVIDDSLTTRMLEQSILESAGYEVELAVSGEEALAKARDRRYSLFVVDVEMPGIDGFEFVAETRADAALRETPAILVTSRNAPEDRVRGQQVGARAYIVKGEFDQGKLLQTIRDLIG